MPKKDETTRKVLDHVERSQAALADFRSDGTNAEGVLMRPRFQLAELKVAREEIEKAISLIERAKW